MKLRRRFCAKLLFLAYFWRRLLTFFFLALATLLISQFPRGHATKDPPSTGGPWIVRLLVLGKNRINQSAKYLANAFIWLMAYAMFWQNPVINATFGQN
jgi:hypothetical protein